MYLWTERFDSKFIPYDFIWDVPGSELDSFT
jgi:hypothetical protein